MLFIVSGVMAPDANLCVVRNNFFLCDNKLPPGLDFSTCSPLVTGFYLHIVTILSMFFVSVQSCLQPLKFGTSLYKIHSLILYSCSGRLMENQGKNE